MMGKNQSCYIKKLGVSKRIRFGIACKKKKNQLSAYENNDKMV